MARQRRARCCAPHGIVHRDVKPVNIMLANRRRLVGSCESKLLDFGIAKLHGLDLVPAVAVFRVERPSRRAGGTARSGRSRTCPPSSGAAKLNPWARVIFLVSRCADEDGDCLSELFAGEEREPPPAPRTPRRAAAAGAQGLHRAGVGPTQIVEQVLSSPIADWFQCAAHMRADLEQIHRNRGLLAASAPARAL